MLAPLGSLRPPGENPGSTTDLCLKKKTNKLVICCITGAHPYVRSIDNWIVLSTSARCFLVILVLTKISIY